MVNCFFCSAFTDLLLVIKTSTVCVSHFSFCFSETFIDLLRLTQDITDWSVLALLLGLSPADFEHVQLNNSTVQLQRQTIIKQWLDSGEATWSRLINALRDPLVNKGAVADKIMKQHPATGKTSTYN